MESSLRDRAYELEAGRDLDALVAEHVFGYHREPAPSDAHHEHGGNDVLVAPGKTLANLESALPRLGPVRLDFFVERYSTDLVSAWRVVEHLRQRGWLVRVQEMPDGYPWLLDLDDPRAKLFQKCVATLHWVNLKEPDPSKWFRPWAYGGTAALAICRVALAAADR